MKADDKIKIICFFHVEAKESESKHYSLLFFSEKDSELLYDIYDGGTNEDKIEYIFGYDAMMESKKRYIDDGVSLFYDIKRWISDFEKSEKVIDSNEKTTFIKRKDIIKAYLEYVISLAQQRFKCKFNNIYISCPSKQKYKFHTLFKDILSDYIVESENILEESVAVLYNTISELIEKKKYVQGVV